MDLLYSVEANIKARVLTLASVIGLPIGANAADSHISLDKNHQLLFSCKSGRKEAYLVERTSGFGKSGGVQYISISGGKPEFIFPGAPDASGDVFKFSRRGYAGGGEYHITFKNGPYTYVMYDKNTTSDNRSLPNIISGIVVLNGEKVISKRLCKIGATGNMTPSARVALKSESFSQLHGIP